VKLVYVMNFGLYQR